jgi:hypothetical protein
MVPITPVVTTTLISCEYNAVPEGDIPAGEAYVILHDNAVLAWLIDETGAAPALPVILGSLPPPAPDTGAILSPPWAVRDASSWVVMVPDRMRGAPGDLFTFLSTNNGAQRKIYAVFSEVGLNNDYQTWARAHPTLAMMENPQ